MAKTTATPEGTLERPTAPEVFQPKDRVLTYRGSGVTQEFLSGSQTASGSFVIKFGSSALRAPSGSSKRDTAGNTSSSIGWTADIQEPTDWGRLFTKLDGLLQLQKGWDGYKAVPPNATARGHARSFLESLSQENYGPSQVSPSVIGGIGANRRRGSKKVYVEFNNNGKVHALFSDGTSLPVVEQVLPDKIGFQILIRRMRAYLDE